VQCVQVATISSPNIHRAVSMSWTPLSVIDIDGVK
jgi:hypothetical protein